MVFICRDLNEYSNLFSEKCCRIFVPGNLQIKMQETNNYCLLYSDKIQHELKAEWLTRIRQQWILKKQAITLTCLPYKVTLTLLICVRENDTRRTRHAKSYAEEWIIIWRRGPTDTNGLVIFSVATKRSKKSTDGAENRYGM